MNKLHYGTLFVFSVFMNALYGSSGLDYLNSLRTQAGMPAFNGQSQLEQAAQNHSDYMQTNSVFGHEENEALSGYTGDYATQRAGYTGYKAAVAENVSAGTPTVEESINGLFAAIYHRFGFLSLNYDEVGIGISTNNNYYTYNMGNAALNSACTGSTASSGYTHVCTDPNKIISQAEYENRADTIKASSIDVIVWPSVNNDAIPPVFYEESPDPLPNQSVSGYPISVQFNEGAFSTTPLVTAFTVKDGNSVNQTLVNHAGQGTVMNENSDPHSKFSSYQHAIFPEKRLEWGSRYDVNLGYTYDGNSYTKDWCFTTRSLQSQVDKFYRVNTDANTSLSVISGQTYAIYIVPNATNTNIFQSYSSSTTINLSLIDRNTVSVQLTGANGTGANLNLGTGQVISLVVSSSDSATVPKKEVCTPDLDGDGVDNIDDAFPNDPTESVDTDGDGIGNNADTDDDNDGITDSVELANGMNPLNKADADADFDSDGFSNSLELSLGSAMRNANDHPIWVPITLGDMMTIVPFYDK